MKLNIIILLLLITAFSVAAQTPVTDSVTVTDNTSATKPAFKPDPMKSVWLGAIIPGYGQIANRSYWKLPIVYAGFIGCAYAISLNTRNYNMYKFAYRDITDKNDDTNSYLDVLRKNGIENAEDYYAKNQSYLTSNFKTAYENYRRYRDMSILVSVGYYAIVLVEAYVDAQLFDFDISPDLSMHLRPAVMQNNFGKLESAGVMVSLNF